MSIYLDYNASSPVDLRVLDVMVDVYKNHPGNADSRTHGFGESAREIVEYARKQVASLLGVKSSEVFFTSGATESNNIAILGLEEYANQTGKKHIITSSIEHKSVLETVKALGKKGFTIDIVNPDQTGRVSVDEILSKVNDQTLLVSIMHVNNETGSIQPVKELGEELARRNILFHVDATQSCGKLVPELQDLKYNMLSFSAHKLRGPQGIGGLVLRKRNYKLPPVKPIMFGGQQERGLRSGTVPVALVAGCGKACELAEQEYLDDLLKLENIKNSVMEEIKNSGVNYEINGNPAFCLNSTLNVAFPGVSSEALMIITKQYCAVSNGSACNSKTYAPSYVLTAMGVPEEQIESSIRFSWGPDTDPDKIREELPKLLEAVKKLSE